MSVTRVQFAQGLLQQLGIRPTQQAVNNLVSWMQAEGGSAEYNPLNTTLNLGLPGETSYNSDHVQNYPSLQAGEYATAKTLKEYPQIIGALNSPPAIFDATVVNSSWQTKDLTPAVEPINATVASKPGGPVTPIYPNLGPIDTGSVGPSTSGSSSSLKPIEWWNPFSWGNVVPDAITEIEDVIYRIIAGGVGLFLMLWGLKMLFDSKGPDTINVFGAAKRTAEVAAVG
jgi:hypothetical protein